MEKSDWTIPDLLQLSGSYWATCALHAGVRLHVFTPLNGITLSAGEVAAACSSDPRAMEMLLNALTSMGLLEKQSSGYTNTPFSAQYLVRDEPGYLGHIILHHHHLMPGWASLHKSITSGAPLVGDSSDKDDGDERESFLMGMYNLASQLAPRIAAAVDLTGCHKLLDFGGGPGTYAIHFCRQNPALSAVVYDLPSSRSFAEDVINRHGLADRIAFTAGNYHLDPGPADFDVAWLSHILHSEGPEGCKTILRKAAHALHPGGTLLVQEFILNDAKNGPTFPALFSLNMLLVTSSGRSYSEGELRRMMEEAGVSNIRRLAIDLPNGAGVLAGTVA
jgi:hypothetical protein